MSASEELASTQQEHSPAVLKAILGSDYSPGFVQDCLFILKKGQNIISTGSGEAESGEKSLEWMVLKNGVTIQDFQEVSSPSEASRFPE